MHIRDPLLTPANLRGYTTVNHNNICASSPGSPWSPSSIVFHSLPRHLCRCIHTLDKVFWLRKWEARRKAKPTQLGALKITTRPSSCGRSHSLVLETRPKMRKKRRSGIMPIPLRSWRPMCFTKYDIFPTKHRELWMKPLDLQLLARYLGV